jgi:uncharacterized DUF497 family protein
MKTAFSAILYLVAFTFAEAQEKDIQNDMYSPLETIITDLNKDSKPDTLSIYLPPVEGDPGQFRKLNISLGSYGRNTFTAKDVWDDVDTCFLKENANAVKSKRVFIRKEKDQTLILLFGFAYSSGREEISIISIRNNKMEFLFDNQLEEPIQFIDLDNDNNAELICQNPPEIYTTDTKTKADIGTYSPFLAYKLDKALYLDKKLTEQYNKQHYVWAGYKYNENTKVRYPKDGKPEIIK